MSEAVRARLLLALLCLFWGVTWPAMKIALNEIPPFSMRASTTLLGTLMLLFLAAAQSRSLRIPPGRPRLLLIIAATVNVSCFSIFTAMAQTSATTSRVAILVYTMPIWSALLARPILGERFTALRVVALTLCIVGLGVLMTPLAANGIPGGIWWALAAAISWSTGTVLLKWARIPADPIAISVWQLVFSLLVIGTTVLIFEGGPHVWPVSWRALAGLVFSGLVGAGLCYFLWFTIVSRVPAMTATLGILSVPVFGVAASMILLGERPTATDIVGFALIFTASALILAAPMLNAAARRSAEVT